jgi:phosphate transport system protein
MALRVDENLQRMVRVLVDGDLDAAEAMLAADDEIDAMNVSLMDRCYTVLRTEAPLASDLRLVVSVLRILSELERIGDLTLRVAKIAPDHELLRSCPEGHVLLCSMARIAEERYQLALAAWARMDVAAAEELSRSGGMIEPLQSELVEVLTRATGDDVARLAIASSSIGRTLDRIVDHTVIIGARVRYLITGEVAHLAAEVR